MQGGVAIEVSVTYIDQIKSVLSCVCSMDLKGDLFWCSCLTTTRERAAFPSSGNKQSVVQAAQRLQSV